MKTLSSTDEQHTLAQTKKDCNFNVLSELLSFNFAVEVR